MEYKIMKYLSKTILLLAAVASLVACKTEEVPAEFAIDRTSITIGAEGGVEDINVSAGSGWYAEVTGFEGKETPWISVSPMNGTGSASCQVSIDTTLLANAVRQGNVRFYSEGKHVDLKVTQAGYGDILHVEETEYEVPEYGKMGERDITLRVTANVQFKLTVDQGEYVGDDGSVVGPVEEEWLEKPSFDFELDREARPRSIDIKVNWQGNFQPYMRKGTILVEPVDATGENISATVTVTQGKAPKIENNRTGDSLAIVAIARGLGDDISQYEGENMNNWGFVTFWEPKDEELAREIHETNKRNNTDENGNPIEFDMYNYIGRLKSVSFQVFTSNEGIPAEVQYLSTVEALHIRSNANASTRHFTTGEYIATLTQLKTLELGSYGLEKLDEDMTNLKNLEYLSLWDNNLNEFPEWLNGKNFPKLKYLDLAANRRGFLYDMSTTTEDPAYWGGLSNEGKFDMGRSGSFPVEVFSFPELEYLTMANNYLMGNIPDENEINTALNRMGITLEKWTEEDIAQNDTLRSAKPEVWNLVGKTKLLPKCRYKFGLNRNLLYGDVPDWMLYHPFLMEWLPDLMVFDQDEETKTIDGRIPELTGIPVDPNYYYEVYPLKKNDEVE